MSVTPGSINPPMLLTAPGRLRPENLLPWIAVTLTATFAALVWAGLSSHSQPGLSPLMWLGGVVIGLAGAVACKRSQLTGLVCTLLFLLAVPAGQYLAGTSLWQQGHQTTAGSRYDDAQLRALYKAYRYDAELFSTTVTNEASLRTFMVNHGYASSYTIQDVTADDLRQFREHSQPALEYMTRSKPDYERWRETYLHNKADELPVRQSDAPLISLSAWKNLFLCLGAVSAFALGCGRHGCRQSRSASAEAIRSAV